MNTELMRQFQDLGLRSADALMARRPADWIAAPDVEVLPWLESAAVNEWFLDSRLGLIGWIPPLTVVTEIALQVLRSQSACDASQKRLVWVGRSCWPTFQMLVASSEGNALLNRCVFLDPLTQAEKIWSIAEALRCPAVGIVIADGSGMDATASRRLQLAAESGSARAFLTRPLNERDSSSWAQTQWVVRPEASEGTLMQWDIELTRARGHKIRQDASSHWTFKWTYEVLRGTSTFHLSARVGHTAHSTPRQIRAG